MLPRNQAADIKQIEEHDQINIQVTFPWSADDRSISIIKLGPASLPTGKNPKPSLSSLFCQFLSVE